MSHRDKHGMAENINLDERNLIEPVKKIELKTVLAT